MNIYVINIIKEQIISTIARRSIQKLYPVCAFGPSLVFNIFMKHPSFENLAPTSYYNMLILPELLITLPDSSSAASYPIW